MTLTLSQIEEALERYEGFKYRYYVSSSKKHVRGLDAKSEPPCEGCLDNEMLDAIGTALPELVAWVRELESKLDNADQQASKLILVGAEQMQIRAAEIARLKAEVRRLGGHSK